MYKKESEAWAKHADFLLIDNLVLEVALLLGYHIKNGFTNPFTDDTYGSLFFVLLIINVLVILFLDTFKNVLKRGLYRGFVATIWQSVGLFLCISAFLFMTKTGADYSRFIVYFAIGLYTVLTYLVRILWKQVVMGILKRSNNNALLIIANKRIASELIDEVRNNNYGQHKIVGLVLHDESLIGTMFDDVPVVGVYDDVIDYVLNNWVDEVLIAIDPDENLRHDIIDELARMGVTVHVRLDKQVNKKYVKHVVNNIGGMLVLTTTMNYVTPRHYLFKRFMDIIGGFFGCIFTAILYLILAPMIKRESPGPVFFSQERVGRNGKTFKIYKFRSMYMDAEERKKELMEQNKLGDGKMFKMDFDPRIIGNKIDENGNQKTGIGQKIRDWSLDEFPQFWNVLKGDMSLVGTRPPLPSEVKLYEAHHKARLGIKPGITGLWQVSGRSNILDFEDVVHLDTEYINNWSVGLDLKILFKTVAVVLKKDGSM